MIVGEVVKLHRRLDWFAPAPLAEPAPPQAAAESPPVIGLGTLPKMQRHTT
jgi:hypothetical protein